MKKILTFLPLIFLLWNCKKAESVSPVSKAELLTKQVWKINKYVIGTPVRQTVQYSRDGTASLQDISKLGFTFKSDGTYTSTDYLGNVFTNTTWKLINNDTQLEIKNSISGNTDVLTIEALDDTQFILTRVYKQADTRADRWTELTTTMRSLGYGVSLTEIFITQSFTH